MKSIDDDTVDKISEVLATELKEIIAKTHIRYRRYIGGRAWNRFVTPDALGPKSNSRDRSNKAYIKIHARA